jgi:Tol biopolymer transport system component
VVEWAASGVRAVRLLAGLKPIQENKEGLRLSWSPAGDWIVYDRPEAAGEWGLYLVSGDGAQQRRLTAGRHPAWSPTRPEIAFEHLARLWLIDVDGSDLRPLTSEGKGDRWPSWSPDGETLVFESIRDGNGEIYRIRRDGTGLQRLTDDPAWDGRPAWRPCRILELDGTGPIDTAVNLVAALLAMTALTPGPRVQGHILGSSDADWHNRLGQYVGAGLPVAVTE